MKKVLSMLLAMVMLTSVLTGLSIPAYAAYETMGSARVMEFNTTYNGAGTSSDDVDFYKLTLNQSGLVEITTTHYGEGVLVKLLDTKGTELDRDYFAYSDNLGYAYSKHGIYMNAGTYYLKYEFEYGGGSYTTSATFQSANESFAEYGSGSNQVIGSASAINLNTKYKGMFAAYDDVDFYKLTLNATTTVTISYKIYGDYFGDSYRDGGYVFLMDSVGNEIKRNYMSYEDNMGCAYESFDWSLNAGTHYFKLEGDVADSNGAFYEITFSEKTSSNSGTEDTKPEEDPVEEPIDDPEPEPTDDIETQLSFSLDETKYVYDGEVKDPDVTVLAIYLDEDGNYIGEDVLDLSDYSVKYPKGRTKVGKYKVKVTCKGEYSDFGSETLTFKIVPKKTSISKLTGKKKGFTVKWKKRTTQTTGYQLQYATNKKFTKGKKTVTVKKNKTTKKTIKKLKRKKTYYVRVRTYKTVDGKKYYSSWSKVKKVKTK